MKRVPVLAMCGLAAAMFATPAFAAAPFANDTPDVILETGSDAAGVFDLSDFFSSTTEADLTFSADGATLDGSVVTLPGSATVGSGMATFSSGDTSVDTHIEYVTSLIGDRPFIDGNNRIAGMSDTNMYFNPLAGDLSGSLSGIGAFLAGGTPGGGTPGGGTPGGGALIVAIGSFDLDVTESGLRSRVATTLDSGAGSASASGITATLNSDGSYSITGTAEAPVVVSLGASGGVGTDVVQMAVAPAVDGTPGLSGTTADVAAGGQAQITHPPVPSAEYVTFTLNYTTTSTAVKIALIGIEDNGAFHFAQSGGAVLEAGGTKQLAATFRTAGGSTISPIVQVDGVPGAGVVTVESFLVSYAPPLTDWAINANASVDLPADGSMAEGLTGWAGDILGQGEGGPSASETENFVTPTSAGSALLSAVGGVANMGVVPALSAGTYTAEVYVSKVSGDAGSFFLVVTDGGDNAVASVIPSAVIPTDAWHLASVSGTASDTAAAFFVLQAADTEVIVDDAIIRVIDDLDTFFDADLAGL